MNFAAIGGRRFVLSVGSGVVTSVLVWFGKIGEATYAAVIISTVGAFITGNVVSDMNRNTNAGDSK